MTWSSIVKLAELPNDGVVRRIEAGEAERAAIAKDLDLLALDGLTAEVRAKPWFDGAEISGLWEARIAQTCGVTLERLDQALEGDFLVRVVPEGSLHAPALDDSADEFDPDAIDPPDVSADGTVDLAAYVVEHMALEIDPFPRKPGAEFQPPDPGPDLSPFAILKRLKSED